MLWTRLGLIAALISAVLLVAGPLGTRAGLWPFVAGFGMLALSVLLGLSSLGLAVIGGLKTGQWTLPLVALAIGLIVVAIPSRVILLARGAPPIHEISTDTADPPPFVAVLPLRAAAVNPPEYGGAPVAEQQRRAFPDIQPIVLPVNAMQAFERTLNTARQFGWEIVAQDSGAGRIEAVDTTFWFGFKDDVVIRVRGEGEGARVDIRSKSRVGVGDVGTNARRVRAFAAALQP